MESLSCASLAGRVVAAISISLLSTSSILHPNTCSPPSAPGTALSSTPRCLISIVRGGVHCCSPTRKSTTLHLGSNTMPGINQIKKQDGKTWSQPAHMHSNAGRARFPATPPREQRPAAITSSVAVISLLLLHFLPAHDR